MMDRLRAESTSDICPRYGLAALGMFDAPPVLQAYQTAATPPSGARHLQNGFSMLTPDGVEVPMPQAVRSGKCAFRRYAVRMFYLCVASSRSSTSCELAAFGVLYVDTGSHHVCR